MLVILAILKRSPRILIPWRSCGLARRGSRGVFSLPAAYEQRWVNIGEVLSPGVRPQDNFLFTNIDDVDHNHFNFLVSLVASGEMIVLAIAAFCSRAWKQHREPLAHEWTLFGWALVAALLNVSFTSFLWEHLPGIALSLSTWRWLLCLNVAFALLLTMSSRRWLARALACIAMLLLLGVVWHRIQPPWWEKAEDFSQMLGSQQSGTGYEGTDEYVPIGADPYEIKQNAPLIALDNGTALDQGQQITIQRWSAESKSFTAEASQPGRLILRLFNYPAWRVAVNGFLESTATRDVTGQMLIPIQAGENHVEILFARTWDRTAGGTISLFTAALLGWLVIRNRLKNGAGTATREFKILKDGILKERS